KKNFAKDIKAVLKGDEKISEAFILEKAGKQSVVSGIMKDDSRISQELFALKKGGYYFYLDNNTGVVIMLSDIVERYLPELHSIKEVVKADLQEDRARKQLLNRV